MRTAAFAFLLLAACAAPPAPSAPQQAGVPQPAPGRPDAPAADPAGTFPGDVVTDARLREIAAAAARRDAWGHCAQYADGWRSPRDFPTEQPAENWDEIKSWAHNHYGPRRAATYLGIVAEGYAAQMRACGAREAELRRSGRTLAIGASSRPQSEAERRSETAFRTERTREEEERRRRLSEWSAEVNRRSDERAEAERRRLEERTREIMEAYRREEVERRLRQLERERRP